MRICIALLVFTAGLAKAVPPDFQSSYLAVGFERQAAEFSLFTVDGLGEGKLAENPVMPTGGTNQALHFIQTGTNRFGWTLPGADGRQVTVWEIVCGEKSLNLISRAGALTNVPPLVLQFDQKARHATLLGLICKIHADRVLAGGQLVVR